MGLFRESDEPEDDSPLTGRIEPTLGPLPTTDPADDPSARQAKTQSGVPVLPLAKEKMRPNAWARFWAQRDGSPEPPSLSKKSRPGRSSGNVDPAKIWTGDSEASERNSWLALSFRALAALLIIGIVWFSSKMISYDYKFPDPMAFDSAKAPTLRILSRDGNLLAERDSKHLYIPLELLPRHVTNAVVAIEDRRFHRHVGVDLTGLLRAAFANLRAGRYAQGGSTITQQLAKNMYLSPERTMMRKLDELMLALWLETRLEKREILELYLNQVYFGGGAYGIEAASQRHFGKSARALTVVEGAIIAGLLKAPSRYSPTSNPAAARKRGRVVLHAMNEAGLLSDAEMANALQKPIRFAKNAGGHASAESDYATDLILERMPALVSGATDTVIVETTIDSDLQKFAQAQLTGTLSREGKRLNAGQGAIVVLDSSGGIRALVGGVDHASSQFNRATKAERQPGSTFKPFVYLTALESGMTPESVTYDLPLKIDGWAPRNANGQYRGEVTLRDALASSINTVAVRLTLDLTPAAVAATARRAGISGNLREDPSLALGTSELNLLDLTGAYTLFANGGRRNEPYVISRIVSSSGRVLYANARENTATVADLRHVGAMNDMLNAALIEGTGRKAALAKHPAAGKTGTSQGFRDAWFVGYTAHMTTGIWLGNDNGDPMKRVVGGSLPARIWHAVMSDAHKSLPALPLPGTHRPGLRTKPDRGPQVARANVRPRKLQVPPLPVRNLLARGRVGEWLSPTRLSIKPSPATIASRSSKTRAVGGTGADAAQRWASEVPTKKPIASRSSKTRAVGGTGADAAQRWASEAPTKKPIAPINPPPLPKLHKKAQHNLAARKQQHPDGSISPDFIANAIETVPANTGAQKKAVAGGPSGFDLKDIRQRLENAPTSPKGREPYMALGAGQNRN